MFRKIILLLLLSLSTHIVTAQYLMDMIDTSKESGKGLLSLYKRLDRIRITGYIQPQFQVTQKKAAKSFDGGDFAPNVDNRFMLRRARVKFEYAHFSDDKSPSVQFVFQLDGTERGVFARDVWGRLFENKYKLFSVSVGLFARPISYELNLSSADRESPERGRMSQLLMKVERDIGAMLSFEDRNKNPVVKYFKIDAGLFNGPGLNATNDIDSHKDFITRAYLKPYPLSQKVILSAAVSYFNGGFLQNTKYIYTSGSNSNGKIFLLDSSVTNMGKTAPRKYYGADIQLKIKNKAGFTELRAEILTGKQTATVLTSETPAALLTGTDGYYIRNFAGGYFYFLQHIVNLHHQLGIKFDWYDPNTKVKGDDIGRPGTNISAANIKYSTLGFGYINMINENVRLMLWYERVWNEKTQLSGFTDDLKDDVFTCRLQFRF
ncbi:MAG: porin [Ferruginibacter sp.]